KKPTNFGPDRYGESALSPVMISARRLMVLSEIFIGLPSLHSSAQPVRYRPFALMRIVGQYTFLVRQVRQKSESSHASSRDRVTVNICSAVKKLPKIIPVKVPAVSELLK